MTLKTPLARVLGLGSAKDGVGHWWWQRLTALALIPLGLWFSVVIIVYSDADYATVTAVLAGAGDVLQVDLTGANEQATITVNAMDEIEITDSLGATVLISGSASVPDATVRELRVIGDGSIGQEAILESPSGNNITLADGAEFLGIDDLTIDLEVNAGVLVDIEIRDQLTINAAGELDVGGSLSARNAQWASTKSFAQLPRSRSSLVIPLISAMSPWGRMARKSSANSGTASMS